MITIYLGLLGISAFVIGVVVWGQWLRKYPSQANAEKASRSMHFLFFAGLVMPGVVSIFYPGLTHLDELLGVSPLPWKTFFLLMGIILALMGLYFLIVSNKLLRTLGNGANAFILTKQVVARDVYKYTRNPMSLGYYLFSLSLGFISGSTLITLVVLLGLVPAHLLFLKYFEEYELELRFGKAYGDYKQTVPFLIPRKFGD